MTDLTIDEAEAWRAGYRAALEAAACEAECDEVTEPNHEGRQYVVRYGDPVIASAIRALPIPDPPPLPDGLCGRGA